MNYDEDRAYRAAVVALQEWSRKATAALYATKDAAELAGISWNANNLIGFAGIVRSIADDLRQKPFSSRN